MEFKYSPINHIVLSKDITNSSHTSKQNTLIWQNNQFKKTFISPQKFINTENSNEIGKHMCQSAKYNTHPEYNHESIKAGIIQVQQKQILTNVMKKDNVNKAHYMSPKANNTVSPNKLLNSNLQNISFLNPEKFSKNQSNFNSNANLNQFFTIKQRTIRQRKYSVNDLTSSAHNTKTYNNGFQIDQSNQKNKEKISQNIVVKKYTANPQIFKKQNPLSNSKNLKQQQIELNSNAENCQFIRDRKLSYQPNISEISMLKKQRSSGQLLMLPQNMIIRRQSDLFPSIRQKKQQKFSTTPMYSPKELNFIKKDFEKKPFEKQKKLRKFSDNNQVTKMFVPSFLAKKTKKQYQDQSQSFKDFQSNKEISVRGKNENNSNIAYKKLSLKNFKVIRQLGEGKFGKVLLVQEINTSFVCAMKVFKKSQIVNDKFIQQFIREMKIQSFLNHPNIIKMYGYFDDAANIYILIELACDGTLFKFLQNRQNDVSNEAKSSSSAPQSDQYTLQNNQLTQKQVSIVMYQLCNAISYLHSQNIIHRDLKPQNIVIHEKTIKLCDFGWSVFKGSTMRNTFCGTPLYLCPQLIVGQDYDQKVDIWAIGIMFYQFLIGSNPFKIKVEEDLANIVYQSINLSSNLNPLVKNLISGCLDKDPKKRFNIKQILNHDFFKQNCPQILNKLSKSGGNKLNQIMI